MHDKPKMLTGLNQNGKWSAAPSFTMGYMDKKATGVKAPTPRVVMYAEHGKPDVSPATAGQPQERLMAQRVKDCGESQGCSVIEQIRATFPGAKASGLPPGLSWQQTLMRIEEHYTDTAGFTDCVFALMHLLGFRFAPRIRDLKDTKLNVPKSGQDYPALNTMIGGTLNI